MRYLFILFFLIGCSKAEQVTNISNVSDDEKVTSSINRIAAVKNSTDDLFVEVNQNAKPVAKE